MDEQGTPPLRTQLSLEWRSMDSAPTDGTRILGWTGSEILTLDYQGPCSIGIRNHIKIPASWGQTSDSGRWSDYVPKMWMPLPKPPEAA